MKNSKNSPHFFALIQRPGIPHKRNDGFARDRIGRKPKREQHILLLIMDSLQMRMAMGQAPQTGPPPDTPQVDTAEQVQISSLALLKMLKHGTTSHRVSDFFLRDFLRLDVDAKRFEHSFLSKRC